MPASVAVEDSLASGWREDMVDMLHGVGVADPYRWLERAAQPAVQAWMQARDDEAREALAALPLHGELARRFAEPYDIDAISPPQREGSRYFCSRTRIGRGRSSTAAGGERRREGADDPNTLSIDGSVSLNTIRVSQGGRYLACSLSRNNWDAATRYLRDLDAGEEGATRVEEHGSAGVAADSAFLHAYSPYRHIQQGARCLALLMMSADSDDRVDPMRLRKFAAGVAWASRSGNPVQLRIERNAGHGGADVVKAGVETAAATYGFLAARIGDEAAGMK